MFDVACWIRSLRQWMGEGGTACCTAGEGRRGRSVFKRTLGLHLRIFCLIGAAIRHCGRCSHLPAGMLSNRPKNSIRFRGYKGNGA